MSCIIRPAIKKDFIPIFKLIQEFAAFEKLSSEVTITPEEFETDGSSGVFRCLVAEQANTVIGYALFFDNYAGFQGPRTYLEDVYLQPQFRGQGLGRAMYDAVCKEGFENSDRLRYAVLDWNVNAHKLFKSAGAVDWTDLLGIHIYRIDRSRLEQLAQFSTKNVTIRKANREDASAIHKLTSEFATHLKVVDHERSLDEFTEDAFGDKSNLSCYVAEVDSTVIGYSLSYPVYSTFQGKAMHLEELFVSSTCRRKGIGKALIANVAKELVQASCSRLQYIVVSKDVKAVSFYKTLGATSVTHDQGWHYYIHNKSSWKEPVN